MQDVRSRIWAGDCLDEMAKIPDGTFGLTMYSPPYAMKTERYPGARTKMAWDEWADWMAEVIVECCRVTNGFVMVNAKNPVKGGQEFPATDWMRIQAFRKGCKLERPVTWHKNSAPNTRPWWVNDWEHVFAFYCGDRPAVWNWEAIAKPPKFSNGGKFSHRNPNGSRKVNGGKYPETKLARPRDVLRVTVGGGHMGSPLASQNEAPYPEDLVRPFVLALSNPGDIVFDPFCGSGTTLSVALQLDRNYAGIDVRDDQVELSQLRVREAADRVRGRAVDLESA